MDNLTSEAFDRATLGEHTPGLATEPTARELVDGKELQERDTLFLVKDTI